MKTHTPAKLTVLDSIPFTDDGEAFLTAISVDRSSEYAGEALELFAAAAKIAAPKAVYRVCYVDSTTDDSICTEHIELHSRIMRVNLQDARRLFPFIATCGTELDDWADSIADPLLRFWADTFRERALRCAFTALSTHLKTKVNPGRTAVMNPGSLDDWPIQAQEHVFHLLGSGPKDIGVTLTDSFLMIPTKSLSGIIVPTERDYVNCKVCPRENCSGRQAPYESHFYEENY